MHFNTDRLFVFDVTHRDVVFLGLDIQQVVDGDGKVVAPDVGIVDGNADVFLFLRRVAE